MPFTLSVPLVQPIPLTFPVSTGQTVFVLGANGTGKSTLMHHFYLQHPAGVRRISAHRQTWFTTGASTLSAHERKNTGTNIQNRDRQADSRWRDDYSAQRASISIYDLVDAENIRARIIAGAVDAQNLELAQTLAKKDAPIKVINELLRLSNLPISVSIQEAEQVVASKGGSPPYSIAELSDGERNALLIAADVLTVKPDTLVLIDEPERHLHRSIISPLLTLLFKARPDCAFVVSTHEVMLPIDNPDARALLLRDCIYSAPGDIRWQADLVSTRAHFSDDVIKEILGARRKILFVEGDGQSLDAPLYSLLFPQVSVVPKAGCRDVEHAVSGIRDATDLHWVRAWGIVDQDRRTQVEIDSLRSKGIWAVPVYAVESIYYHPEIQRRVAERHASVTGGDAAFRLQRAKDVALAAIAPHAQRLAGRAVEKTLREEVMRKLPKQSDIAAGQTFHVSFDMPGMVAAESARLSSCLGSGDLLNLTIAYPLRETPALTGIATSLGFQGRAQYEGAVLKLLMDDPIALAFIRNLFGSLGNEIAAA